MSYIINKQVYIRQNYRGKAMHRNWLIWLIIGGIASVSIAAIPENIQKKRKAFYGEYIFKKGTLSRDKTTHPI